MAGKSHYPPAVDEAIWLRLVLGDTPKLIRQALATDTAGVGRRIEMPERTLFAKIRRLRETRDMPSPIPPSQVDETLAAERGALTAIAQRARQRLEARERNTGDLTASDLSRLSRLADAIAKLERGDLRAGGRTKRPGAPAGTAPPGPLAELAAVAEAEGKLGPAPESAPSDNGN